uniref:Protein LKAAEAR1 n=1 Tax=Sus scrofa TaxID=9823 RepID=A0A8D0N850_PIG
MQPPAKEAGRRGPGERAGEGRAKGPPAAAAAAAAAPLKPGWVLTLEGLAALSPAQRHSHLLFGDLLEDVGAAASVFPRESAEPGYRMPDPRAWTQPLEPPGQRQDRLLGILKAAEARGRGRALRLRYNLSLTRLFAEPGVSLRSVSLFLPPSLGRGVGEGAQIGPSTHQEKWGAELPLRAEGKAGSSKEAC